MSIMKKVVSCFSTMVTPNARLAKWKQMILGLFGRKFDKMVDKYGRSLLPFYLSVESNGAQLQEAADPFLAN